MVYVPRNAVHFDVKYSVERRNVAHDRFQHGEFEAVVLADGHGGLRVAGHVTMEFAQMLKQLLRAEEDRRFGQPHYGHHDSAT
jgi:hypothetical protein